MEKEKIKPNEVKRKRSPLQIVIYIILAVALIVLSYFSFENRKKAAYTIAYVNVPQEICQQINKALDKQFIGKIENLYLDSSFKPSKKELKKIDLVITWNGKLVKELVKYSTEFQPHLTDTMTASVAKNGYINDRLIALPILYDCQLLNTVKNTENYFYLSTPDDFTDWISKMEDISGEIDLPLCVAGGDDIKLVEFTSAVFEAVAGTNGYKKLLELITDTDDYQKIYETVIPTEGNHDVSLKEIVELINSWKQQGYLAENWKNLNQEKLEQIAASSSLYGFTDNLLSLYSMNSATVNRYNHIVFPQLPLEQNQNIIGRLLVMVNTGNKNITSSVTRYLTLPSIQTELSAVTGLVPVDQSAAVGSNLLDDIRFYATYSPQGVLPDILTACFSDEQEAQKFCQWLRGNFL